MPSGDLAVAGINPYGREEPRPKLTWLFEAPTLPHLHRILPALNRRVRGPAVSYALLVPELSAFHLFLGNSRGQGMYKQLWRPGRDHLLFFQSSRRSFVFPQNFVFVSI